MATPLEQWWAVQVDPDLTVEMKTALLNSIRAAAFNDVNVPVEISGTANTITGIHVTDDLVECVGTGPLSWPLRLHNPPIGVPDPDGTEIAPNGVAWRTDPAEVIADATRSVP